MNLYFVHADGRIVTPATGTILEGITRASIIELAGKLGHQVEERRFSIDEWRDGVASGDIVEIFACGTAAVVTPVGVAEVGRRRGPGPGVDRADDADPPGAGRHPARPGRRHVRLDAPGLLTTGPRVRSTCRGTRGGYDVDEVATGTPGDDARAPALGPGRRLARRRGLPARGRPARAPRRARTSRGPTRAASSSRSRPGWSGSGVRAGGPGRDAVAATRVDGVLAHLAVLCAGAATVVVDPGSPPAEVARQRRRLAAPCVVVAEDLDAGGEAARWCAATSAPSARWCSSTASTATAG